MKLKDLLAALANNQTVNITLIDDNDNILITFGAPGYSTISDDLGNRDVKWIKIVAGNQVTIAVQEANNSSSNTDPTDPSTDPTDPNTDPTNP